MTRGGFGIRADYRHGETPRRDAGASRYWTRLRRHTHPYFQAEVYRYAREIVTAEGFRSVLDVGCGPGEKLRRYLRPHVEDLVGVDQAGCLELWTGRACGAQFVSVDLESAGAHLGRRFDFVMAVDVIEHLDDPDRLLDFMREHMNPRSKFMISTPEREILRGTEMLRSPKPEHVREWNSRELLAYLASRGMLAQQHRIVDSYDTGRSAIMLLHRIRDSLRGVAKAHTQVVLGRLDLHAHQDLDGSG
jgi:SAM-dependent methyltransferase